MQESVTGNNKQRLDYTLMVWGACLLLFIYIYVPSFIYFPVNLSYVVLLISFAYFSYGSNLTKLRSLFQNKSYVTFTFFYIVVFTYIILITLLSEEKYNKDFVITYIRFAFDIFLVLPFFVFLFRDDLKFTIYRFLHTLVIIGVIQGIIASLMFISPVIRDLMFGYIINLPSEKLTDQIYRGFGMANDFYFAVPLFQGITFLLSSFLYVYTRKYKYLIFLPFILISMVLNARISILVIPVFVFVIFVISFFYDDLKWIRRLSGMISAVFVLLFIAGIYFMTNPDKLEAIEWALSGITGAMGALGGDITQSRTLMIILSEHWHFPHEFSELLFGKGLVVFANSDAPVRSDLGYIRFIYYGGVFLSLLMYFAVINFVVTRATKSSSYLVKGILLALLLSVLLAHFKGDVFNSSAFMKGVFLILIYTIPINNTWRRELK